MTKTELLDRLETWIMIHSSNDRPLPPAQTPLGTAVRGQAEREWTVALLHNVTQLEHVPEIKSTPAGDALAKAVALAKTGDAAQLPVIETCLRQVHTALRKGPQA